MTTSKNATASFHTTEESSILLTTLNSLLTKRSPEKFNATLALFQTLLTLLTPVCREGTYLKAAITGKISECYSDPKKFLESLIYIDVIDPDGTRDLSMEARWIVDTVRSICGFIEEVIASHQTAASAQETPVMAEEATSSTDQPSASTISTSEEKKTGMENARKLMAARNEIVLSMVKDRLKEKMSSPFEEVIKSRLEYFLGYDYIPNVDVYGSVLHYHSRLSIYAKTVGTYAGLLVDLEKILYAGMPKNYQEFDDKIDRDIRHVFEISKL